MPATIRQLRVFLCHASQDKSFVREFQKRLSDEGWIDPWLDEKKLHPGEDWRISIEEAVESSDLVVICLSNNSVDKEGFVQKELRYAREIALEKTEGTIFLIPLRLEACDVPRGLRFFQWADYFGEKKEENYTALLESFSMRRQQIARREQERVIREAEEKEKREREEKAHREAEELAKREAQELVRRQALEIARKEEEERAHVLALEKARKEAYENALEDARGKARLEAEVHAQKEINEKKQNPRLPNLVPVSFFTLALLLLVVLVIGIGLAGLRQMGLGPFAKSATPTSSASSPEFVTREYTGVSVNQSYDIGLNTGEIIVGQSYGFSSGSMNQTGGCSAFLIKGPGQFSFSVTDGVWEQYKNVASTDQAESLLQEQVDYLVNNYSCTAISVKYSRLP